MNNLNGIIYYIKWRNFMEKPPKSQKEYYQDRIREYEKRTGKSMNVKGVSKMYYDYDTADTIFNYSAALDLLNQKMGQ